MPDSAHPSSAGTIILKVRLLGTLAMMLPLVGQASFRIGEEATLAGEQ
jgi:hypothetical protein